MSRKKQAERSGPDDLTSSSSSSPIPPPNRGSNESGRQNVNTNVQHGPRRFPPIRPVPAQTDRRYNPMNDIHIKDLSSSSHNNDNSTTSTTTTSGVHVNNKSTTKNNSQQQRSHAGDADNADAAADDDTNHVLASTQPSYRSQNSNNTNHQAYYDVNDIGDEYETETIDEESMGLLMPGVVGAGGGGLNNAEAHRAIIAALKKERATAKARQALGLGSLGGTVGRGNNSRTISLRPTSSSSSSSFSSSSTRSQHISPNDPHIHVLQQERQQELEHQDAILDGMSANLDKLGQVSAAMSAELTSQQAILSHVETVVSDTQAAVHEATHKIKEIVRSNGGPGWCSVLVILSVILAILTYIAIFT